MKRTSLLLLLSAASCTKPAADFSIAVEIDGQPAPPIDKKKIDASKPDFEEGEQRAWSIAHLLGPAMEEKSLAITVFGKNDLSATMPRPHKDREAEPVLLMNGAGMSAAMVAI